MEVSEPQREEENENEHEQTTVYPWLAPNIMKRKGIKDLPHIEPPEHYHVLVKALCILNKITPSNFNSLAPQFMDCALYENEDDIIPEVVLLLVEKASHEQLYSSLYARLANVVRILLYDDLKDNSRLFREELMVQAKSQLERFRGLGNIRFLIELYKLQMLTPTFMVDCVKLFHCGSSSPKTMKRLCALLIGMGHGLEKYLRSVDIRKSLIQDIPPETLGTMDDIIAKLERLRYKRRYSTPLRFKFLEVIQLRKRKWRPRIIIEKEGPKVIEGEMTGGQAEQLEDIYNIENNMLQATEYKLAAMDMFSMPVENVMAKGMGGKLELAAHIFECHDTMEDVVINEYIRYYRRW